MEIVFRLTDIKKTVGSAGFCPVGRNISPQYAEATVGIGAYGMPFNKVVVNHLVLREALLNSPAILKEMGLKVVDLIEEEKKAKVKAATKPQPKVSKEVAKDE